MTMVTIMCCVDEDIGLFMPIFYLSTIGLLFYIFSFVFSLFIVYCLVPAAISNLMILFQHLIFYV